MTLYQKIVSVFSYIRDLIGKKASKSDVAGQFVSGRQYVPGDIVYYEGTQYVCKDSYSGDWDAAHFDAGTVSDSMRTKVSNSEFSVFDDITVGDSATQRDVRVAVQQILERLKAIATCVIACVILDASGIDRNTAWEDVPPTTSLGQLIDMIEISAGVQPLITDGTNTIHANGNVTKTVGGMTNDLGRIALTNGIEAVVDRLNEQLSTGVVNRATTIGNNNFYRDLEGREWYEYNVITCFVGTVTTPGGSTESVSFVKDDAYGFVWRDPEGIYGTMTFIFDDMGGSYLSDLGKFYITLPNASESYIDMYEVYSSVTNVRLEGYADSRPYVFNLTAYRGAIMRKPYAITTAKTIPMFIIPVNDNYTEGSKQYLDIELKASTNNFSSSVTSSKRLVYYCHTSITNGPNTDNFMLFVENQNDSVIGSDGRSYVRRWSSIPIGWMTTPATRYVLLINSGDFRRTDGSWCREDNDELIWTYARTTLGSTERDDENGWVWRPISPVKWFSRLPKWADQEPR